MIYCDCKIAKFLKSEANKLDFKEMIYHDSLPNRSKNQFFNEQDEG